MSMRLPLTASAVLWDSQADIAIRILRLYQIDMARFAIGTVNGDVHIASAGIGRVELHRIAKGLDGNIRQALFGTEPYIVAFEQAAILIDGTFLRCDGDGRARPALAGLDFTGQGDIGLTRHIDGRIAILIAEETNIDAMPYPCGYPIRCVPNGTSPGSLSSSAW